MKRLLLLSAILLIAGSAGATNIKSENITVDLSSSTVESEMDISELTTSKLTYSTSYRIRDVNVTIDGEKADCEVQRSQILSEIRCETDKKNNFSAQIRFRASGIIQRANGRNIFRYSKSFPSPTDNFRMNVVLPTGTGLVDSQNASTPVVLPKDYGTESNGRRITVSWDRKPDLGESIEFRVIYEQLSDQNTGINIGRILIALMAILATGSIGYLGWRKINQSDIEKLYEELSEDEIELIELLRDNEGELLQKEAVDRSEYSKAKISEVVSSLEEQEIIVKEKEGRSNKLKISGKYRY